MRAASVPVAVASRSDRLERALAALHAAWRSGQPALERIWAGLRAEGSIAMLAALVKADLACRFERGQRPTMAEYLDRFPALRDDSERVLSLVYEEFCLREERGERPDVESFCERYAPWRDSLASQLKYHQMLSRVGGPAEPPPPFPEPGEHFQEFYLRAVLGRGGAARVYLARDDSLGRREVALKVSPDRGNEPSILGRLDHPHIIPVWSVTFDPANGLRGLCMPYHRGLPLDEVIRRAGAGQRPTSARAFWDEVALADPDEPRPKPDGPGWEGFPLRGSYADAVAWVVAVLAEALAYAHSQGILHRDVKPANVLMTLRKGPQLLDFNLAHAPESADQAEAALRGGTLPYMAPEQLEAFLEPARWGRVGASADLYSLGLLLRELLTGRMPEAPDPGLSPTRAIRALLDRRAALRGDVRALAPAIPRPLEAICARCLAFEPSERYARAEDLADDLRRFLGRRSTRFVGNHRNELAAGVVLLVLLASGAALSGRMWRAVPIERRPAFLDAARAVEEGAISGPVPSALLGFADEDPSSPLAHLYLALALNARGDTYPADQHASEALRAPGTEAVLERWARDHPGFVPPLRRFGDSLFERGQHDLARRVYEIASRLDPTDRLARFGLARSLARFQEFSAAHELLTQLVEEARRQDRTEDRAYLNDWLPVRARVAVQLGTTRLGDENAARALFEEALGDLSRVTTPGSDPRRGSTLRLIEAEARLALGDLNARLGRGEEAARERGRARTLLSLVDRSETPDRDLYDQLSSRIVRPPQ